LLAASFFAGILILCIAIGPSVLVIRGDLSMEIDVHRFVVVSVVQRTGVGVIVQVRVLREWLEGLTRLLGHRWLLLAGGVLFTVLLFEHDDLLGQEVLVLAMRELELLGAGVLLRAA